MDISQIFPRFSCIPQLNKSAIVKTMNENKRKSTFKRETLAIWQNIETSSDKQKAYNDNAYLVVYINTEYVIQSKRLLTLSTTSSAFSALSMATLNTTLKAFSENWYIGCILLRSFRMKYSNDALAAAGRYTSLVSLILISVTLASFT